MTRVTGTCSRIIAVGASVGGPDALGVLLSGLPADLPATVMVVQHIPAPYLPSLENELQAKTNMNVLRAEDGAPLTNGQVILPRDDRHLTVEPSLQDLVCRLRVARKDDQFSPSVDALFTSVARTLGRNALGIILTGMGHDGVLGASRIREGGGVMLAQDEATSAVWGMPRGVVEAGAASQVLPLPRIAEVALSYVTKPEVSSFSGRDLSRRYSGGQA